MAGGRGKEHLKGLPSFINLTGGRTFRVANAQRTSGIAGAELVYASSKPLKPTTVKGETVRPRVIDFDVDTRFTTEEAARAALQHENGGGAGEPLRLPGAFATYTRSGAALANHGVGANANVRVRASVKGAYLEAKKEIVKGHRVQFGYMGKGVASASLVPPPPPPKKRGPKPSLRTRAKKQKREGGKFVKESK